MNNVLLIVDMQNDFISGSLGTDEAKIALANAVKVAENFDGQIIFTRDTHDENYLSTQEGEFLPIEHCIKGTSGWEIASELESFTKNAAIIDKPTFGSLELATQLQAMHEKKPIDEITLIGLCTDICVATNALLIKTLLPEVVVKVKANACAGVSPEKHDAALETMRSCQVQVID